MLAAALALIAVSAAASARPLDTDVHELVEVEEIVWPVIVDEKVPGACDALPLDRIRVSEDGRAAQVVAFERERMPTDLVLLLDVSGSRESHRYALRHLAERAIDALRDRDRMAIALFAEDLVLHAPLVSDRALLRQRAAALDAIEVGGGTAFLDAMSQILAARAGARARTAVVLVSDGCENASLLAALGARPRDAPHLEALAADPHAVVFGVSIDASETCPGAPRYSPGRLAQPSTPEVLRRLTEVSGGATFFVDAGGVVPRLARELGEAFDEVRTRLDAEGTIVYRPPETGVARLDARARRVRVETASPAEANAPDCVVRSAGRDRRRVRGRSADASLATWDALCGVGGRQRPPACPDHVAAPSKTIRDGSIDLRWLEPTLDRGALYTPVGEGDAWRATIDRAPELAMVVRSLSISNEAALRARRGIEAAVLAWIERGRLPELAHGAVLLERRGLLAEALATHPPLRRWAEARLVEDAVPRAAARVARWLEAGEIEASQAAIIEEALVRATSEPSTDALGAWLAAWIEDLAADELARRMQVWMIDASLAEQREDVGERAALLRRRWPLIRELCAPATTSRLVVPLAPIFDHARGVFGFFRVVRPHPGAPAGGAADGVEIDEHPMALALAQDLLFDEPAWATLAGQARVQAVRTSRLDDYDRAALRVSVCDRDGSARACADAERAGVRVDLTLEAGSGATLRAWAHGAASDFDAAGRVTPVCVGVVTSGEDARLARLAKALRSWALERDRLCRE